MDPRISSSYWSLRIALGLTAFLAGLDKFFNLLAHWTDYVSPMVRSVLPFSATTFMHIVGVIEIVAGLIVLFNVTRFGAYIVMAWLIGIAIALLTNGKYFDVAVRDLVMAVGAYSLGRLAAIRAESTVRQPVGALRTA
jgi:uncharacterized membrane protein YphA (DoxX/SURF4 family)